MLRIDNLTYRIGPRVLLDGASASIDAGHKVGLVGRNGTGKTTLLRLITRTLSSDGGEIEVPSRWRIGITSQEAPSSSDNLIETVLSADRELAALNAETHTATDPDRIAEIYARLQDKDAYTAEARAARILAGLGFDDEAQLRPCSDFSGGWRMRVALAGLLFTQPELLLLDEPTNHLDLEATIWLEDYLKNYPGTILLVSHDRDLLNRVPDEILHLENGKLTLYRGGYDKFDETRRMRIEHGEKQRAKQDARRAELQSFVDRFRAKASKAKQAQSRLRMIERMPPIVEHSEEGGVTLTFPETESLSPPLFNMDHVTVGYDGKPVLKNVSLRLDEDDRIALLGANGNGKSTFVKLLAGKLNPMAGEVSRSGKLRIGYFAQHQTDELDVTVTPLMQLGRKRPQDSDQQLRSHLGSFSFTKQRAETIIGKLSGGEKARLLFALMAVEKPHILLLDEPTNHLDIASREALIDAINSFKGAVILISHDPHILELTVDQFWLVENGQIAPYDGDMEDYRNKLLQRDTFSKQKRSHPAPPKATTKAPEQKRVALAPLKRRLEKTEARIAKLTAERDKLREALADPTIYQRDSAKAVSLQRDLGHADAELAVVEGEWIQIQEELEQAQAAAG